MISHKNKIIEDKVMDSCDSPDSHNIDFSVYYQPFPATVTFSGHKRSVYSVALLTNNRILSGSVDKTLKVWDISSGKCLRTLFGHREAVNSVATLSSNRVISASNDETIKIWNLDTGQCELTLDDHAWKVTRVKVMRDGVLLSASEDNTVKVFDPTTVQCISTFNHKSQVYALNALSNGQIASGSRDGLIVTWDLRTKRPVKLFYDHESAISSIDTLPGGLMVSGSGDTTLKIWDLRTNECIKTYWHNSPVITLATLSNNRILSSAQDDTFKLWDLNISRPAEVFSEHGSNAYGIAMISDQQVVTGGQDKTLKLWTLYKQKIIYPKEIDFEPMQFKYPHRIQPTKITDQVPDNVKELPVVVPAHYLCPITGQIMLFPATASDGYNYEQESIQSYLSNQLISPVTQQPIKNAEIVLNNNFLLLIRDFLKENPQFWEDDPNFKVYFPHSLQREAIAALELSNIEAVLTLVKKDARLLTRPLNSDRLLIELIVDKQDIKFLTAVLNILTPQLWQKLFDIYPLHEWLNKISHLFCPDFQQHRELLKVFLHAITNIFEESMLMKQLIEQGFHESSVVLLVEGLSRRGGINTTLDKDSNTALHHAAKLGNLSLVKGLLEHGACPKVKNKVGHKPKDLAKLHGHIQVQTCLFDLKVHKLMEKTGIFKRMQQLELEKEELIKNNQALTEKIRSLTSS